MKKYSAPAVAPVALESVDLREAPPPAAELRKKRAALQEQLAAAAADCAAAREAFYASERKSGDLEAQLRACESALMDCV